MEDRSPDEPVSIGVIGRAHGLRGEVRVSLYNPESVVLFGTPAVTLVLPPEGPKEYAVLEARAQGRGAVVRLAGVDDRSAAEALRGASVLVPRGALPDQGEGEHYDVDLIGLAVRGAAGGVVGRVVDVEHPPAADVLVIELAGGDLVDVPFVDAWVRTVDVEGGYIEVDVSDDLPRRPRT